jgi:hypothetical protein
MATRHSITTVFEGLKQDSQTWERLLWTSEVYWNLVSADSMSYWKFDTDGNGRMLSKAELQTPSLLLTEGDTGNLQQVNQLDLNDHLKLSASTKLSPAIKTTRSRR